MNFDRLFKEAKARGIEDIQIYLANDNEFEIEVLKGELEKYTIASTQKLSVKGIYDSKMGNVETEIINDDMIDFIVDSIIASAKTVDSEDEVFIYKGDKEYKEVEGLFNPELDEVDAKIKIDNMLDLEKRVMGKDKRIRMVQAFYGDGSVNVLIQNSKGLKLEKLVNNGMMGVYVIASDGKDQRTAFEYTQSNNYSDFDLESIATKGAEKAVALLGAEPCDSGEYEILLSNEASASLLAPYLSMFSAEMVQRNLSLLKGKVGEVVGDSKITIVDDPFMKKSTRSGAFDDEGVATSYKELIKDGVLTGYLHNLKTAKKDNTKSTGNGFLRGIRPTNFYIKPGDLNYDEAVKVMEKGLIITDLAGTHAGANPISGDFSLQASGFLVEDGKIVRPVALITVAGNYLTMLQNVTGVCDDLKFNFRYIGSPALKIKSLVVSGK
ncbi:MAG: TldD/PmbA family protein [Candidatus Izimaplasma sp.]|nr:TldD/PmbA family protein [Candidatus Izimaplasma bacterium]